jgi:hypothetical protein
MLSILLLLVLLLPHRYVSGSNDDVKPSFRQYRKRQQPQQQQRLKQ